MFCLVLPLLLTLNQSAPKPQQLQGAHSLIATMPGAAGVPVDPDAEFKSLAAKLKDFGSTCEGLAPDVAAEKWLALLEASEKATQSHIERSTVNPSAVMEALPPPAAWPARLGGAQRQTCRRLKGGSASRPSPGARDAVS